MLLLLYRIVGFTKPDPFSGPSFRRGESPSGSFRGATRTEPYFGSSEFNAERPIKLIGIYKRKIGKYFGSCFHLTNYLYLGYSDQQNHSGNYRIFLLLRFYVKSKLVSKPTILTLLGDQIFDFISLFEE